MTATTTFAVLFVVLLAVEWRYHLGSVGIGTALFALVVWFFAQPNPRRAARIAIWLPPQNRVTEFGGGTPLTEYQTGVATMEREMVDDASMGQNDRLQGVAVLLWLACTPAFRRKRGAVGVPVAEDSRGDAQSSEAPAPS